MKTEIHFKEEVLKKVLDGVHKLAKTVGSTLGPGGKNVVFENFGYPLVTKDGVTVARQINLLDKHENIGAQMVKQVANKTCENAGDGTTTATVLADAILTEGVKVLSTGLNPIAVKRGIDKAVDFITNYIDNNIRVQIEGDNKTIKEIATLSANWDDNIGSVVAEAISKVGIDGSIQVNDPKTGGNETTLKLISGVKFERGFTTPYYITDETKQLCSMDDPYILLVNGKIEKAQTIMGILGQASKNNANLVIIADDFSPEVTQTLVINKTRGKLNIVTLKSPWYKDMRTNTMEDMCVYFNTSYFDPATYDFDTIALKDLGRCKRAIVTSVNSTFIEGCGSKEAVDERIEILKKLKEDENTTDTARGNVDKRISQLKAAVAIITIGSNTEVESNEKRDRIDDALSATRAAVREGIVPGGTYSYLRAVSSKEFTKYMDSLGNFDPDRAGAVIIKGAVISLFKKLLSNAGKEDSAGEIMTKIFNSKQRNYGYDVKNDKMCDLIEAGVVDPWLVCKQALVNSASVSGLILTSDAIITTVKTEQAAPANGEAIPSLF